MTSYIIATTKSWNIARGETLKAVDKDNQWFIVTGKEGLTAERVRAVNPRYIFFPHWSWIIPKEIYENFECVVFHMTDLPYGRGGSPLQNLIVRGHTATKISALRVDRGIDTGAVYMKRDLSLAGTADDILRRASDIIFSDLIPVIVVTNPIPVPQNGEPVTFSRRKPEDGNLTVLFDLRQVYDYIRMLDGEGYPHAFLETKDARYEFFDAHWEGDSLTAKVAIHKR